MKPIVQEEFHSALKALPLLDWVIVNRLGEVLTGYRENAPVRHTWFTPGGRIRKGEPVMAALARDWPHRRSGCAIFLRAIA